MSSWKDYREACQVHRKAGTLSPYLPVSQMHHVRQEFLDRLKNRQMIDLPEYKEMRMNSYERLYLTPLYTNDTLIYMTMYAIQNSRRYDGVIPGTYDEVLIHVYAKELCLRLEGNQD